MLEGLHPSVSDIRKCFSIPIGIKPLERETDSVAPLVP
jgi:hypothetical protein